MKVKEIVVSIEKDDVREEVKKTIQSCLEAFCCEYQRFMEVEVNQRSTATFQKILESLEYGFLVVIAEYTKEFPERKITVFCNETKAKDDEFTIVKKNRTEIYCIINLSKATVQHLNKKKQTT